MQPVYVQPQQQPQVIYVQQQQPTYVVPVQPMYNTRVVYGDYKVGGGSCAFRRRARVEWRAQRELSGACNAASARFHYCGAKSAFLRLCVSICL